MNAMSLDVSIDYACRTVSHGDREQRPNVADPKASLDANDETFVARNRTHPLAPREQRKADDGDAGHDGVEVSHPGEPAEVEADAVSEKLADKLHGGEQAKAGAGDRAEKPGRQQAPAVAAKLTAGLKIFRAEGDKKRG